MIAILFNLHITMAYTVFCVYATLKEIELRYKWKIIFKEYYKALDKIALVSGHTFDNKLQYFHYLYSYLNSNLTKWYDGRKFEYFYIDESFFERVEVYNNISKQFADSGSVSAEEYLKLTKMLNDEAKEYYENMMFVQKKRNDKVLSEMLRKLEE